MPREVRIDNEAQVRETFYVLDDFGTDRYEFSSNEIARMLDASLIKWKESGPDFPGGHSLIHLYHKKIV